MTVRHAQTRPATGPRRMRLAVVLGCLTGLGPFSIDMYLPALPSLASDLKVSPSLAQLSLTACLLGLALGQLVAGPISDALGRRRPLLCGLAVYAAASGLCAWTHAIWALVFIRFFQGLAGASGIVIARAVARDHFAGVELTRFFALLMLVNGAAPVLAPIVGGQLLRLTSWHGIFIVLCLLGVVFWMASMFFLPESLPPEGRTSGGWSTTIRSLGGLLRDVEFVGFVLAQGMAFAAMFGYISGSSFVLQELYGVSPQGFSVIFAVNGLGIIAAGQLAARVSMRFGERRVLAVGLGLAAAAGLLLVVGALWHAGLTLVLIGLFVAVASIGCISTTCGSLALQNHGKRAGSASAWLGVSGMLLGSVASPLVGIGGSHMALPMAVVIAVCHLLAGLCYWLFASRPSGHRAAMPPSVQG
ncbi:MAG: multidrug effflux MFS transporter [Alicyclobacillus herbarius]|uniref:multidrug effflux MFS transporter n=1 Tax=Alicyclobacillus herbarius TaxID=122960 RepID=UPI0006860455|nr:multidrug effflux MFS transporter [Alicyclobacillus herbarius]MCL6632051.1 multidrug effflux MFS transporter [Alicyclobacillus herbarius]